MSKLIESWARASANKLEDWDISSAAFRPTCLSSDWVRQLATFNQRTDEEKDAVVDCRVHFHGNAWCYCAQQWSANQKARTLVALTHWLLLINKWWIGSRLAACLYPSVLLSVCLCEFFRVYRTKSAATIRRKTDRRNIRYLVAFGRAVPGLKRPE